jgi:hypothetical protein
MTSIETAELDTWVETLSQCKQLTENDVKRLCDKVELGCFFGFANLLMDAIGSRNSG